MKRYVHVALILAAVLVPRDASATLCDIVGSIATAAKSATTIVVARVERVTHAPAHITQNPDGSETVTVTGGEPDAVDLVIEDTFKGTVARRVSIATPVRFTPGSRYVIYGAGAPGALVVHACARVRPVADADTDIRYLTAMRSGVMHGVLYGQAAVRGADGYPQPLNRTTMVVVSPDGGRQRFDSNRFGWFEVSLAPGPYEIWIERDGGQITNAERMDVEPGDQPKFFVKAEQ